MIEARGIIPDVEKCIKKVESLKGTFKDRYAFTDVIYIPTNKKIDLKHEFIRLRIYKEKGWSTKDLVLTHKLSQWTGKSKIDTLLVKEEFDELSDAKKFIDKHFNNTLKEGFKYSRKGWMYQLGKVKVYIEQIEKFPPSVEVQTDTETEITDVFKLLGVTKRISESAPEFMRKILT